MQRRIRVLFVVENLRVGGVREVLLSQISSLDTDRFEVGLLTLRDDPGQNDPPLPRPVLRLAASYRPTHGYGVLNYLADGLFLRAARRFGGSALAEIVEFAPDVLHFHTHARVLGLGILAERRLPTALVFTDHQAPIRPTDYSFHARFLLRLSLRRLYRHYHVISVGPSVARFNREGGLLNPSRRHLVLENQVDLQTFRPPAAGRSSRPLQIIYVGRINTAAKGTDILIRAFAKLRARQPVRLVLVGPDATDGAMQALADERVPAPLQVDFVGPRTDVPELLRRASIGVLPSRREGMPLALLEQMACGLAVVASDIPENQDIVSHGIDSLVVPVDDAEALAGALQTLLRDPELRTRLGQAARKSVERRVTANATMQLAEFYEDVATRDEPAS